MGDDSSGSLEGKSLSNMRVVDLKAQLEKRGLSKSGSKKELVKRLKQKLELEKLYEESAGIGDSEPKLHLDEATEQNEFVKHYLAEQQKIYARQKEVKRLIELKEQQRLDDEEETDSDFCNKDQDSDVSESVSVAKNSCDSSTHAEGGEEEEEEETKSSEDREYCSQITKEGEPESSTEGDLVMYTSKVEPIDPSESSHSQSSMDSANPDSALSYTLSDIQLPESPKKLLPKITQKAADSADENAPSESLEEKTPDVDIGSELNAETNGTAEVDESSNHSRKSTSSVLDHEADGESEPNDKIEVTEEKERTVEEPMDIDSVDNKLSPNTELTLTVKDTEQESLVEDSSQEMEKAEEKSEDVVPSDSQYSQEADSSQKDSMDISESKEENVTKKKDIEEGETDVDSGSSDAEALTGKRKQSEDNFADKSRTEKLARQDSHESNKSRRSSSREKTPKETRSSSSDSSSSCESVPKRKSYHRSKDHDKEDSSVSSSSYHSHGHVDVPSSSEKVSTTKAEASSEKPRRIKIKRSTPIVVPGEPEAKKEVSKSHHKKIEMQPEKEERISSGHASGSSFKSPSKREPTPKKRSAEESSVTDSVPPPKVMFRKLNVSFHKKDDSKNKTDKKRSWNSIPSLRKTAVSISTDSLKSIIPDFKVICSPSILNETEEKIVKSNFELPPSTKPHTAPHSIENPVKIEKAPSIDEIKKPKRRESIKEIPAEEPMEVDYHHKRTVISEKAPSNMLYICNLVRPFTLLQLKEVLRQTGTLDEDSFWIDKIKSKCLVTYKTEEEAVKTRDALNNTRWPASNPKILSVEFVTKEEFDMYKSSAEEPKPPPPPAVPVPSPEKPGPHLAIPDAARKKEREEKDRLKERERQRKAAVYMREWDKDKLSQDSPERERERHHSAKGGEKIRSAEKDKERKGRTESIKEALHEERDTHRRQEEDTPAKLLDDLFQKTKAAPCIYWLPLTEERVKQKEEERRLRRLEREKRKQEQEESDRARRKPREKNSWSRSRSPARRR